MLQALRSKFRDSGVSTLPTMLLLGGIIIEIAIAIAFLTYYFNTLNYASRLSAEALETARAGVQDAIIKVVRDKDCPNVSCPSPYTVETSNGRTATVSICKDTCSGAGKTQVISTASALNRQKKIQAILSVDPVTGQVAVDSLQEAPL